MEDVEVPPGGGGGIGGDVGDWDDETNVELPRKLKSKTNKILTYKTNDYEEDFIGSSCCVGNRRLLTE